MTETSAKDIRGEPYYSHVTDMRSETTPQRNQSTQQAEYPRTQPLNLDNATNERWYEMYALEQAMGLNPMYNPHTTSPQMAADLVNSNIEANRAAVMHEDSEWLAHGQTVTVVHAEPFSQIIINTNTPPN